MSESPSLNNEPFIVPREGFLWGFVYLRPRTEKKFSQKLTDWGVRTYLPLMKKTKIHHRGKVITYLPMFTSYVFLQLKPADSTEIIRFPEVLTLDLPSQSDIQAGLISDLNRVRKCEILAETQKVVVNPGIQPGMNVLVKSGPLAGTEVVVLKRINEVHIIVNLSILGRHCDCLIDASELQLLT